MKRAVAIGVLLASAAVAQKESTIDPGDISIVALGLISRDMAEAMLTDEGGTKPTKKQIDKAALAIEKVYIDAAMEAMHIIPKASSKEKYTVPAHKPHNTI